MGSFYGTGWSRRKEHKYKAVPVSELQDPTTTNGLDTDVEANIVSKPQQPSTHNRRKKILIAMAMITTTSLLFMWATVGRTQPSNLSCDTVRNGYVCEPRTSHFWGQYSPYFSVPSEISAEVPSQCTITFAQVLSRHGARNPTSSKAKIYKDLVNRIHATTTSYSKDYNFLEEYQYALGADELTVFGQQQMVNSGVKYYKRYENLAKNTSLFVRTSGSSRVIESAQNFTQGFHAARLQDRSSNKSDGYPYPMVTISEDAGYNNTLNHGLCTSFENGYDSTIANSAQGIWASVFTPTISGRLNANLPGMNFTTTDTIHMMDLCPFDTVSYTDGTISPFCNIFTESEWKGYDYYQSIGKYYGYSWGNPLGATQGVGFTNELIARMTASSVNDHTSTNSTLDSSAMTFPVGGHTLLYADFSHDNDMTAIFSAIGLYNSTAALSNTTLETAQQTNGYKAAWTTPFAGRAYFEKMSCKGVTEELVRVVVNDRVVPLETCGMDKLGRCPLSRFVESLSFAKGGGNWDMCFV